MSLQRESCRYCGTVWVYETQAAGDHTGWSGFLLKNMYTHWALCEKRTPAERRAWAKRQQKRLERKPNDHTRLYFDFDYDGMKDGGNS